MVGQGRAVFPRHRPSRLAYRMSELTTTQVFYTRARWQQRPRNRFLPIALSTRILFMIVFNNINAPLPCTRKHSPPAISD